jgi:hypothetical protein
VSKFHSILCLLAQESRLIKKSLVLRKTCAQFWVDRTTPDSFPDKSENVLGRLVWVWSGLFRIGFFNLMFIHYFGHILLTMCPIDLILFPLHLHL